MKLEGPTLVDMIRAWPRAKQIVLISTLCPTLGYLLGVIAATPVFRVTNPITTMSWLAFAFPAVASTFVGLRLNRPRIAMLGLFPQWGVIALICAANHATLEQVRSFWPVLLHAEFGPGLGIAMALLVASKLNGNHLSVAE